jgi:hypothetical protein
MLRVIFASSNSRQGVGRAARREGAGMACSSGFEIMPRIALLAESRYSQKLI